MSSLAAAQGIPIPTEEIRSALESVAIPGYTGTLQLEIGLRAEAAACVMIGVIRRQSKRVDGPLHGATTATRQELPDPTRKKPVDKVIDDIRGKLMIRTVLTAVEAHYADGVLQKFTIVE
jgi:hypothetical protein